MAAAIDLPPGYYVEWGGQFENQQRAAARLAVVVPVSLGLIFLLLFSTFGSVRQALLVLTNIPLALVGGVLALFITGEYLSVPASVGFIALLGIAVLNGVALPVGIRVGVEDLPVNDIFDPFGESPEQSNVAMGRSVELWEQGQMFGPSSRKVPDRRFKHR